MNPCDKPCPKCGSAAVKLRHYFSGDIVIVEKPDGWRKPKEDQWIKLGHETYESMWQEMTAQKEFIRHECAVCHFEWNGDILLET